MRCVVGIDLGSTTTKAVLLDEEGALLGRGITNSRSNYEVACAVAREEALGAARFDLLRRTLETATRADAGRRDRAAALQSAFRLEQYLEQLADLRAEMGAILEGAHLAPHRSALTPAMGQVMDLLVEGAPALFAPGSERKSDFFRDLAAAAFMHAAEKVAASAAVPFDRLAGLFDRAILNVETRLGRSAFGSTLRRAAARVADEEADDGAADALLALAAEVTTHPIEEIAFVGTGYGRQTLPFPKEAVRSEILCHGRGAHRAYPGTRSVLDIGGQDTKAIQVDAQGVVTGFQMNDRCAAGCGRYLGYIADELNLGLHELGPLALQARKAVKVNSTCTVFAGAELRERLALGQRREDILAGLHRSIMLRAMSLVARSGGISNEFTFTGGVCRNPMATRVLGDLVRENYGEGITINTHPDSIYMGALGAALFALDDVRAGRPAVLPSFAARQAEAA